MEIDELQRERIRSVARIYIIALSISAAFGIALAPITQLPFWQTSLIYGLPTGTLAWLSEVLGLRRYRHRSFLITALVRSVTNGITLILAFMLSLSINIAIRSHRPFWEADVWRIQLEFLRGPTFWLIVAGSLLLSFVIAAVYAVSRKLGPGVLGNWLLGYYHEPREEARIFLFLDLRGSTPLAESLGAFEFSALVRDCFSDLTEPVLKSRASIHHYVGDEAVLTWPLKTGLESGNCLKFFFLFTEKLAGNAAVYRAKFGVVPEFKAGAHLGHVIATEVGDLKSEIVYHGDVLNTASRIEGLCNPLNCSLLISEELYRALPQNLPYTFTPSGPHELKGKQELATVYEVTV